MSELRIFLVIVLVGVAVCQGAAVPERSHRYPRSKCTTCQQASLEELAEEWDTPDTPDSSEQYSERSIITRPAPLISRPLHPSSLSDPSSTVSRPFYRLMRAERSPPSEESDKKVLVVYRGDLEHQPTVPEASQTALATPLSDKQLEEIVTRAILSAKRQAEAQNLLDRRIRLSQLQNSNLRELQDEYMTESMRQHMMHMRALGPREFPVTRDPYTVYGGVTDHWDGLNFQKIEDNTEEEQEVIDSEDLKGVVSSGDAKKDEEKPKEEIGDTQGEGENAQEGKTVDPTLVEDMEAPPTDDGGQEPETTTPAP